MLFVLESLVPTLPWMKLGLGNLPVLVALLTYGFEAALGVILIKLLIGGLLSGMLGGPALVIGGSAGLASLLTMALIRRFSRGLFSIIGLSIWGALTHQVVQLWIAAIYVGHAGLFRLLPLSLIGGLVSGGLVGLLAFWTAEKLRAESEWPYWG